MIFMHSQTIGYNIKMDLTEIARDRQRKNSSAVRGGGTASARPATLMGGDASVIGNDNLQVTVKSHQIDIQNYLKVLKNINVCKSIEKVIV